MFTRLDLLLLLMVLIWGANFTIVKIALRDFPELAFNGLRLITGAVVVWFAIWRTYRAPAHRVSARPSTRAPEHPSTCAPEHPRSWSWLPAFSREDWRRVALLGVVGHMVYQFLFLAGVKRTSVGNASLILGVSPILVALLTSWAGHERVPLRRWAGAGLSFAGLYLIVGRQVEWSTSGHLGDALMLGSALCWAGYSVGSVALLRRHSPLVVTGTSMAIGAVLYNLAASPIVIQSNWLAISALSWILMVLSAVLALAVSYLIWYTAVQRIGSTRTSMYSYLTPIVATTIAAVWLGEPVSGSQLAGAAAIFAGLFITRLPS